MHLNLPLPGFGMGFISNAGKYHRDEPNMPHVYIGPMKLSSGFKRRISGNKFPRVRTVYHGVDLP